MKSFSLNSKTRGISYLTHSPNKAGFLIGWCQTCHLPSSIGFQNLLLLFLCVCLFLDPSWILLWTVVFYVGHFVKKLLPSLFEITQLKQWAFFIISICFCCAGSLLLLGLSVIAGATFSCYTGFSLWWLSCCVWSRCVSFSCYGLWAQ